MKYLLLTDIPAPWREKVYENVYKKYGNDFHVVYCKHNEKRRLWKFPLGNHSKTFLKSATLNLGEKERYFNIGIINYLIKNKPKVIICFSLQPIIFLAFLLSKLLKIKIAILSDAWLERDRKITWIQKLGRKLAYNFFSDAFIGASKQTLNMYRYYNKNISDESLFLSALCADNEYFKESMKGKDIKKKYDIMFSGRIVALKNPLFFADVAIKIREKLGNCRVLIIGDGDDKLKEAMFNIFEENSIDYHFAGFIKHDKLPEYYSQAKILLFPTSMDCWGVVINEAFVSGVPVITTDMTAAAGELVINGKNGYVLAMDSDIWAEKIYTLLKNTEKLHAFSNCAIETVNKFNFKSATQGIIAAIEYLNRN